MKRLNVQSLKFFGNERLPLHLKNMQFFAEGGEEGSTANPAENQDASDAGNNPSPTAQPGGGEITLDVVRNFVENNEQGKKWLQSFSDSRVTDAIKTYESKTLPKKLEEEIAKRFPPETEEQRQLRELQDKFQSLEQEKERETLRNKALSIATEKGLPTNLVDFFIGQDEAATEQNLGVLSEAFKTFQQNIVNEQFKQGGSTPPPSGGAPTPLTHETIEKMTPDEINKNWDRIQEYYKGK
ncbi:MULTISPECIES: DUF4355 domain-containing protein [unclassified Bacillus (in: firmicutes)]|uniref:DUF4355 domain-containing protein n=1 Tax=unclassified Bacillus (in: firmicutes) TaxID=185979 RepID=UPI0025B4ABF6|nr:MULTISPECIES: DUF4355 domain-containing protein [unclassified Bacillus (in: firmicutes)]MDN0191174.1 DUF4355 domain-containing protein [Bacillus sp. B.PNR1]MDN3032080.1 DUF4355 domain-containing protein [Bacillus sp. B.PNR2]